MGPSHYSSAMPVQKASEISVKEVWEDEMQAQKDGNFGCMNQDNNADILPYIPMNLSTDTLNMRRKHFSLKTHTT